MAIALRAYSSGAAGGSVTVSPPSGLTNGDVMVAWAAHYLYTGTMALPAGWTQLYEGQASLYVRYLLGWKLANNESGDYTFTQGGQSNRMAVLISAWSGVDNVAPINTYAAGTTDKVCPDITTTVNSCMCLSMPGSCTYNLTYSAPEGVTFDVNQQGGGTNGQTTTVALGHFLQATAGSTGTKTWSAGNAYSARNYTLALAPAASTGLPLLTRPGLLRSALLQGRLVR